MLILSIDTSSADLSVALVNENGSLGLVEENMLRGQGEALIPYIQSMMQQAGLPMNAVEGVAVAVGPGSFTGVRVGLSTARGIGLALDIPVYGVTNLEAAAAGLNEPVTVTLDTKRGDYYTQQFDKNGNAIGEPSIQSADDLKQQLPFTAIGDGAMKLAEEIGCDVAMKPQSSAISIAQIALSRLDNPLPAEPLYLREADVTVKNDENK